MTSQPKEAGAPFPSLQTTACPGLNPADEGFGDAMET